MRRQSRPTLHTVAKSAGVSIAIVSRVVNGRHTGMTAETRARVETAIKELGYLPNRAARSLRTARQNRVALIISDRSPGFLTDPFTTYVTAGLSNALSERDYGLLLQRVHPGAPCEAPLMRARDADAVALFLSGSAEERLALIERCRKLGSPLLVIQEPLDPVPQDVCVIRQDDRQGGRWLGQRMRRRKLADVLGVIPELPWPATEERLRGLREGLGAAAGLSLLQVDEADTRKVSRALDARFAGSIPQAVFANNDQLAAQVVAALRRAGRRTPEDVAVCGFNAFPVTGALDPPLTTIASPAFELGAEGACLLIRALDLGRFATQDMVLPVKPVVGSSL